ncbi:ARM REPEAT PROTEIN INTERACTING WITH ABF2-like [Arachis hypogaea]|uniref:ARM REPEAT PROTEIN INTERACTING WITH ABF2-like n=1 Tax=Arachis hypogaea TaxID=3818 RepID=UPI003B21D048
MGSAINCNRDDDVTVTRGKVCQSGQRHPRKQLHLRHRIRLFAVVTIKLAIASEIRERVTGDARDAILDDIQEQVFILNSTFSWKESDRAAAKCATHALADLAKNEEVVNMIVEGGAILALVQHLQAPPVTEEDLVQKLLPFEHEVEKGSAFALGLLAVKNT